MLLHDQKAHLLSQTGESLHESFHFPLDGGDTEASLHAQMARSHARTHLILQGQKIAQLERFPRIALADALPQPFAIFGVGYGPICRDEHRQGPDLQRLILAAMGYGFLPLDVLPELPDSVLLSGLPESLGEPVSFFGSESVKRDFAKERAKVMSSSLLPCCAHSAADTRKEGSVRKIGASDGSEFSDGVDGVNGIE